MAKYDSAGLAMIPSGYKASKVYSLIPNSSDGDFDFARSSSATRVNKDGLIEVVQTNVPRLDYPLIDGVVQDTPSLLLEPSRTNSITYSEDFSNASWINAGTSETSGYISVTGSSDAWLLEKSAAGGYIYNDVSTSGNQTFSLFIKAESANWSYILLNGTSTFASAYFDLENGAVGSTSGGGFVDASIEKYPNNWYRIYLSTSNGTTRVRIYIAEGNNQTSATSGGLYIYGSQLEAGSYATSYIPTSGSTVTRAAETCNGAGTSADFNDSEGVLFAEMKALSNSEAESAVTISDDTYDERVIMYTYQNYIYSFVFTSSGTMLSYGSTNYNVEEFNKISIKYKSGDYALWINGFEVSSNSNTFTPTGLKTLDLDDGVAGLDFKGDLKQVITFKQALTDAELEDLTSWDSFNEMATQQLYTIE